MRLASVALALVVGAGFAILLRPIQDSRKAERSAQHSQDVLIAAYGLEQRVLDLETGQRGFILTRQPQFFALGSTDVEPATALVPSTLRGERRTGTSRSLSRAFA